MSKPAKAAFCFTITTILSFALAQAQQAQPLARHPGDVIKYEIRFDGPNADRIKSVNAGLASRIGVPKDQAGFRNGFPGNAQLIAPKTFDVTFTVPDNAADGDYSLNFSAIADEGYGNYSDGQEFNVPPVRIENPKKFTPPSVTVKPLP